MNDPFAFPVTSVEGIRFLGSAELVSENNGIGNGWLLASTEMADIGELTLSFYSTGSLIRIEFVGERVIQPTLELGGVSGQVPTIQMKAVLDDAVVSTYTEQINVTLASADLVFAATSFASPLVWVTAAPAGRHRVTLQGQQLIDATSSRIETGAHLLVYEMPLAVPR